MKKLSALSLQRLYQQASKYLKPLIIKLQHSKSFQQTLLIIPQYSKDFVENYQKIIATKIMDFFKIAYQIKSKYKYQDNNTKILTKSLDSLFGYFQIYCLKRVLPIQCFYSSLNMVKINREQLFLVIINMLLGNMPTQFYKCKIQFSEIEKNSEFPNLIFFQLILSLDQCIRSKQNNHQSSPVILYEKIKRKDSDKRMQIQCKLKNPQTRIGEKNEKQEYLCYKMDIYANQIKNIMSPLKNDNSYKNVLAHHFFLYLVFLLSQLPEKNKNNQFIVSRFEFHRRKNQYVPHKFFINIYNYKQSYLLEPEKLQSLSRLNIFSLQAFFSSQSINRQKDKLYFAVINEWYQMDDKLFQIKIQLNFLETWLVCSEYGIVMILYSSTKQQILPFLAIIDLLKNHKNVQLKLIIKKYTQFCINQDISIELFQYINDFLYIC